MCQLRHIPRFFPREENFPATPCRLFYGAMGYEQEAMSCEYFLLMVQPSFTFDCYIIGMRRRSAIVQASLVLRVTLYIKKRVHLPKT